VPIYVYKCSCCGNEDEIVRKITDPEIQPNCSKCEEGPMERVLTSSTFVLKGSGWAKDGYSGGKK